MADPVWFVIWCFFALTAGGLEFIALYRPSQGDTLSENLRPWVRRNRWVRWLTFAGWLIFSVWFAVHIWFD